MRINRSVACLLSMAICAQSQLIRSIRRVLRRRMSKNPSKSRLGIMSLLQSQRTTRATAKLMMTMRMSRTMNTIALTFRRLSTMSMILSTMMIIMSKNIIMR